MINLKELKEKMKMKKAASILLAAVMCAALFAGCSNSDNSSQNSSSGAGTSSQSSQTGTFDTSKNITVVTREAGSGTRDAFTELTGVLEKDGAGSKTDNTSRDAVTVNSTQAVISNVTGNEFSIGYISLGSLNDTVKAVKVDGVEASPATVKDGTYKISRPFNIATKKDVSEAAQDFISFILSTEGQKVVTDSSYIALDDTKAYEGGKPSGKIVVAGSSSVSPVMEKLKEAYAQVNPNATVEIQTSDSSTGMTGAMEGTCDIGMASRELKDEETAALTATVIALDGIAVVVNKGNSCDNLTMEQVKSVYTGGTAIWADVVK